MTGLDYTGIVLVFVVILSIIMFGMFCVAKKSGSLEHFSPTGWTQNCPQAQPQALSPKMAYGPPWRQYGITKIGTGEDSYIAGSYSPGSVFKCKNEKDCPMLNVRGCAKRENVPLIRDNLPLGWGSTMTGPYAGNDCMMNVNGVNKPSMRNPYGKVYPYGDQMYGFCEKGANNYFDDNVVPI